MTNNLEETTVSFNQLMAESGLPVGTTAPTDRLPRPSKDEIRTSLHASTLDGIFATLFSNLTGGVLLSNFFVELQATSFQIGLLASAPMLANLLQPLGAYWADHRTSRRTYSLWVYGISRLLWLPLAIAIILYSRHPIPPDYMILATLTVMMTTHVLGAAGSASWLSWLATLIPRQLRGRYFGFRNSTFNLTSLLSLPMLGLLVSHWMGGSLQGFGIMMMVGVGAGVISLGYQSRMTDVNPRAAHAVSLGVESASSTHPLGEKAHQSILNDTPFLLFLLYFGVWAFGINLSNPFFNLYLLDTLALDVSWVTFYNALGAGANLVMLLFWGKLADRIGNRTILILDGVLVALTPLLWLGTDAAPISLWLWFPLLHLLGGGTGAAIDLCINNLQLAIAPVRHHTKYFATTAAVGGICGAMGALVGGWLAQLTDMGGITGLFAFSSMLRLVALLPLVWLREPQRRSLRHHLRWFLQKNADPPLVTARDANSIS